MKIIIGTKNQKKIKAVQAVFEQVLGSSNIEIIAHDAPSCVPEAPQDHETLDGAMNRARECEKMDGADFYVGIESGLVERYNNFFEEAWAVIIPANGEPLLGYSSGLMLPNIVATRIRTGEKHNEIMKDYDKLFARYNDNNDTWSRYTGGNISRQISLDEAVRNALIQSKESAQSLYKF